VFDLSKHFQPSLILRGYPKVGAPLGVVKGCKCFSVTNTLDYQTKVFCKLLVEINVVQSLEDFFYSCQKCQKEFVQL
jgi:hypothetical protein